MKKFFSFVAALCIAFAANAAETEVSAGVNTLRTAVAAASAGDVLVLGDGTFYEEGNFDMKINLTIKAAEGAKPVIANRYYFRVEGGADVTFQGIKFDGAGWRSGEDDPIGASDYLIRSYSSSTGEEDITFENCEFTGYPSYIMYTQRANRKWNSITINGCYFYNNKRSAVYIGNESGTEQSCNALTIKNSTFANVTGSYDVIYYTAPADDHTTTLSVDHCTFYGHPKRAIYWQVSENLTVSNCIFAQPAEVTYKSVECVSGTISNCLSYNSAGYSSAATNTNNVVADPLFVDAANGDYRLALNSPARKAGSDGKTLGDPRWWPMYQVSTHSIDFGDVEKGSGSAMESFYLKGADLTANVRIYDFTIPYGAVFSKSPAAVTPVEAEYTNGKKVEVYAAKYVDVAEYKGYLVLESPDFPNDTIWLRANIVEPAPAPEHTFTVAGDNVDVFGTSWDPTNTANDMVLQDDNTYKWEKTGLTLPKGQIAFKVVKDHDWSNGANAYPADNYIINIAEAGIYTIDIYFNPNDNNYVGAVVTKTGDAVVIPTIAMHGNFLGNWADTQNFAVAEGDATASLTLNLAAGNYEFGMRIGGSGNWTANGVAFTRENSAAVVVAGSDNLKLAADVAGDYTFTWTYETNTLSITFPTATAIENTNAAVKAVKMIENGQMIIIKNGVKYNAQGAIVK